VEDDNGQGGGTEPDPVVSISPENPTDAQAVTITYNPAGRSLAGASQVYLHAGRNGWQNRITPRPAMTLVDGKWTHTLSAWSGTTVLDMVFTSASENGSGTWDNNGGQDWHFAVTPAGGGNPPATPAGLVADSTGPTSVSLAWNLTPDTDSYLIFRNDTQVAITGGNSYADTNLLPATPYAYAVAARNASGDSAPNVNVNVTTDSLPAPPATPAGLAAVATPAAPLPSPEPIPFVMDGMADFPGYQLSNPGMVLHAALRGNILYVSTWAPGTAFGNDHFILVGSSVLTSATTAAPWGKAGKAALPSGSPFLASESSNDYIGWSSTNGATSQVARAAGQRMEGTLNVAEAFGSTPRAVVSLHACLSDGGWRHSRLPGTRQDHRQRQCRYRRAAHDPPRSAARRGRQRHLRAPARPAIPARIPGGGDLRLRVAWAGPHG
jgi:hypothetical protein